MVSKDIRQKRKWKYYTLISMRKYTKEHYYKLQYHDRSDEILSVVH
ncbi:MULTISPECIES: hypothetical protein [Elizabethkingia]|nr:MULTISPECIES: hypothetical protein [Elizabethkingia]